MESIGISFLSLVRLFHRDVKNISAMITDRRENLKHHIESVLTHLRIL
jgi:hypothetical protein